MRSVRVGDIEASAATVATGFLTIGELADGVSQIRIPVIVINGAEAGPIIYLHAGSHGQETPYCVQLMRRLRASIDPARLRGAIIATPVANVLAHQSATRVAPHYAAREGVPFAGDLHKLWPGDSRGSITQRIAHALWTYAASQADCAIDFHAVGEPSIPFIFMYRGGARDAEGSTAWQQTIAMGEVFGLTMIATAPNPLTLGGSFLDAGKPCFMVEMIRGRNLDSETVGSALRGTLNVLKHLGMIEGSIEPQDQGPLLPGVRSALPTLRANRGGFIEFEAQCGVLVPAGAVVARIVDVFGVELESIVMPTDGYVMTYPALSWVSNQSVATGDLVADIFA